MATNEMPFSHPASPQDLGPTTGHFIAAAGSGVHSTERSRRGAAVRQGQAIQPPPRIASPLQADAAAAFAREWAMVNAPRQNVGLNALAGGVIGLALVKAIQNRRGR